MSIYSVVRKSDGVEVHRYNRDTQMVFELFPAADYDQIILPDPEQPPIPAYSGSWRITKLAFRSRFTAQEKVTIELASLDNPAASDQQRQLSAALRSHEEDVAVAQFIDLKRTDTRDGAAQLETFGLIAAGRAAVILDTEPTADEVFA